MRIIAFDPGLANLGFAVLDLDDVTGAIAHVVHGVIQTPKTQPMPERMAEIARDLTALVVDFAPTHAAYEHIVAAHGKGSGASEAIMVTGVILAVVGAAGLPTAKYPPQSWKVGVVPEGGRAEKIHVQVAMRDELGLEDLPKPEHAADALGVGVHRARRMAEGLTDAA